MYAIDIKYTRELLTGDTVGLWHVDFAILTHLCSVKTAQSVRDARPMAHACRRSKRPPLCRASVMHHLMVCIRRLLAETCPALWAQTPSCHTAHAIQHPSRG